MGRMNLHLGCGKRDIPGFINIEQADFPHIHYRTSIDYLPMFKNDTIDLIYCSHAFEYFDREQALQVLKEWCRILKPKGVLRLAVPNFDALITLYQETGQLKNILGPLFGRMKINVSESQVIYHRTVYNYIDLKCLLESCGFIDVQTYDWRETIHKDYDDHSQAYYPHMDKENGVLLSLNVEGTKK